MSAGCRTKLCGVERCYREMGSPRDEREDNAVSRENDMLLK